MKMPVNAVPLWHDAQFKVVNTVLPAVALADSVVALGRAGAGSNVLSEPR